MDPNAKKHWEDVYRTKGTETVSWYRPTLDDSLELVHRAGESKDAPVLDVGGGASTLVDSLLAEGFEKVSVLDLSGAALEASCRRLAERCERVRWLEKSVLDPDLPGGPWRLWHDRAVFHFLVEEADRRAYFEQLERHVLPGGHALFSIFAEDGPSSCSGLPVRRHSEGDCVDFLGDGFELEWSFRSRHLTPAGREQSFVNLLFRKRERAA